MRPSKYAKSVIFIVIIGISLMAWSCLLFKPTEIFVSSFCSPGTIITSKASFAIFLALNPFINLFIGWMVMVIAMMLPKLIMPIEYIYVKSLRRNRLIFAILFSMSYVFIWAIVGLFMVTIILLSNWLFPNSILPAIIVGSLAIIWQFSPLKQKFLNFGHAHQPLSVFGLKAIKDIVLFGIMHGIWCVGSGWAIMLFPMLLHDGHNVAMLVVSLIMISEHLDHPRVPKWQLTFRLTLFQYFYNQAIIRISKFKSSLTLVINGKNKWQYDIQGDN